MSISDLSIKKTFSNKTVIAVGATGFIGKVWLSLLLEYVPDIKKIYVLVRPKKGATSYERFNEMYINSPAFKRLHSIFGTDLKNITKLEILSGDICLPKIGINDEIKNKLRNDVDLVVNFAADLRFWGPIDHMLHTNVGGVLNTVDFIKDTKKAKLLHISTCYVAGAADGIVSEHIVPGRAPNGTYFSVHDEYEECLKETKRIREHRGGESEIRHFGAERVKNLGWPNTYTYSKAIAEMVLAEKLPAERLCVFRPSIVETAEKYPFPGWNEDLNGTAPFMHLLRTRYRYIVAKPFLNLDIIPVDYVAKGLTIAASALLSGQHFSVYQCSTSALNPISVGVATEYAFDYYRSVEKKSLNEVLIPYPKPKFISPDHFLSGNSLRKFEKTFSTFMNKIKHETKSTRIFNQTGLQNMLNSFKKQVITIDTIMGVYKPFIYDYNYTFKSEHLSSHLTLEKDFLYSPIEINWDSYWKEIHMPGLKQWCLPRVKMPSKSKQKFL